MYYIGIGIDERVTAYTFPMKVKVTENSVTAAYKPSEFDSFSMKRVEVNFDDEEKLYEVLNKIADELLVNGISFVHFPPRINFKKYSKVCSLPEYFLKR